MTMTGKAFGVVSIVAAVLTGPRIAHGQPQAATAVIERVFAGDCAILVPKGALRPGDRVAVEPGSGGRALPAIVVTAATTFPIAVPTGEAAVVGETFRLKINGETVGADVTARPSAERPLDRKPAGTCAPATAEPLDDEPSFDATGYFGWAYDQFAPDKLGNYKEDAATISHNRSLFGVDFDYRVFGRSNDRVKVWLAGQTLHGVRSADIDCTGSNRDKLAICKDAPNLERAKAILEGATSVEAYIAPRIELFTLQRRRAPAGDASIAARFYVTYRAGFIALVGAPDFYRNDHVGMGLMLDDSVFEGTTLEVGIGNNELLWPGKRLNRLKVSAILSVSLDAIPLLRDKGRFFVEMFLDTDPRDRGQRPDSMQTFIGFDFDFRKLLGGG